MKFHGTRPRFSTVSKRLGFVLGAAAIGLGAHGWTVWTGGARHEARPTAGHGERGGRAHVGDGDSVTIDGVRLRLIGIDAPELAQVCHRGGQAHRCGDEAKAHLEDLVGERPLACVWDRLDLYGRGLAHCRAGAVDLGAAMVRDGWALAYGGYEAEEAEARRARRGLWAGDFEWPEDVRRRRRDERPR